MSHKEKLDKLITKHYDYFLDISNNITRRLKKDKYDLLHEVFASLYTKLETSNEYLKSDTDFRKYVNRCLGQLFHWKKNERYAHQKDNNLFTWQPYNCPIDLGDKTFTGELDRDDFDLKPEYVDRQSEQLIYLNAENTNQITKLFLEDMFLNDIPIEKGLMVNKIKDAAKTLDLLEYQIFDMYYLQELSCADIHKEMNKHKKRTMGYHYILNLKKQVQKKIINQLTWE